LNAKSEKVSNKTIELRGYFYHSKYHDGAGPLKPGFTTQAAATRRADEDNSPKWTRQIREQSEFELCQLPESMPSLD